MTRTIPPATPGDPAITFTTDALGVLMQHDARTGRMSLAMVSALGLGAGQFHRDATAELMDAECWV